MKSIHEAWLIQIEVTNVCHKRCSHCSRAVPHIAKPFFMELEQVEKGLQSLKMWPKGVGCMGGEPTLHPKFEQICNLYKKYVPRKRAGLWSSGGPRYKFYETLIKETFGILLYNDHSEVGKHQPLMVGSEECVPDKTLREKLIDSCWLQKYWSPAITPKGAFFCEVAAVFDFLFDGPGGYELTNLWWLKNPDGFVDQRDRYCGFCSIPVPFPPLPNNLQYDYVSPGNAGRLRLAGSPWAKSGRMKIIDERFDEETIKTVLNEYRYAPWEYLGENKVRDEDGVIGTGYAKERDHRPLSDAVS